MQLPNLDFNICNYDTTRYRRTHPTECIKSAENLLNDTYYKGYKTVLCNSGMEAIVSAFDVINPKTVIYDDETYFETRNYLEWKNDKHLYNLTTLHSKGAIENLKNILDKCEKPCIVCIDCPTTFGNWYDVKTLADIIHSYRGSYLMVDNSIVSCYYYNPLKDNADICVESYSKWFTGGTTFAGGIAFNTRMKDILENIDRIPSNIPTNGISPVDFVVSRRGNVCNQFSALTVMNSMYTLKLRLEKHTENALKVKHLLDNMFKKYNKKYGDKFKVKPKILYSGYSGLLTILGFTPNLCKYFNKDLIPTLGTFGCMYTLTDFFRDEKMYRTYGACVRLSLGIEDKDTMDKILSDIESAMEQYIKFEIEG